MKKYNVKKLFNSYKTVKDLGVADIFHLYDTGKECMKDDSGFHNARHFILWAFNTKTMEKCNLGEHDGIYNQKGTVNNFRVFADGSFLINFNTLVSIHNGQAVLLN